MIRVENAYDFTVEELTDILENTPIKVDLDTNAEVAEYIIQALNINAIVKKSNGIDPTAKKKDGTYHIEINRNKDGKQMFECDAHAIAFFTCDMQGNPHKTILSEQKPTDIDIDNICELLGEVKGWSTLQ